MLQDPRWKLGLRGEVLGRDALPMLLPAWEELSARSVEDNVYYSPRYARALIESVEKDRKVRFAVVWDDMRLVAMLPFTGPLVAIPLLRSGGQAWRSKYTFSCMPLLDEVQSTEAASALLDVLASISKGEWVIPTVNTQGDACRAMMAALARQGLPWAFSDPFQRAALEAGGTFDEHMSRHVSSKRRKDLARSRRRLDGMGTVAHRIYGSGEDLDLAVSAFLKIEANGWKGKRGTALACDEKTRAFAMGAFTGEAAASICRADVLTLDEKPIAVSLIVSAGRTGFAVKCCYDEAYRSCSAGLLLEVEVIRSFFSDPWARRLDAGTAGTHVIDSLWPGRIEVADLMFSVSPRYAGPRLRGLRISSKIRRDVISGMKRGVMHLRQIGANVKLPGRGRLVPY